MSLLVLMTCQGVFLKHQLFYHVYQTKLLLDSIV